MNWLSNNSAVALLNDHGAALEYLPTFLTSSEEHGWRVLFEQDVGFDSAQTSRVFVHGQWRPIPRRQCAHGDDDLDPTAPIASLSLGSVREFQFRPRVRPQALGTVTMLLQVGSLLSIT